LSHQQQEIEMGIGQMIFEAALVGILTRIAGWPGFFGGLTGVAIYFYFLR